MGKSTIRLAYLRGLLVAQKGRCAMTGRRLHPAEVNADHIVPLSRPEHDPADGQENFWLVNKKVNAAKGAMTYDELVLLAKEIIAHEGETRALLAQIETSKIEDLDKQSFDNWVKSNCDDNGIVEDT